MPAVIEYCGPEEELTAAAFLSLATRVWPGEYDTELTVQALIKTHNFTAWHGHRLVGCARLLTDGHYFSTMPEILVDPDYRRQGVGSALMEMAWKASPTSLGFGVQAGNEAFFESLGYESRMHFYVRRKQRQST